MRKNEAEKGIDRADTRFYEEGVFKIGKAYKLLEDYDALRAHMAAFKDENPRSPRVASHLLPGSGCAARWNILRPCWSLSPGKPTLKPAPRW